MCHYMVFSLGISVSKSLYSFKDTSPWLSSALIQCDLILSWLPLPVSHFQIRSYAWVPRVLNYVSGSSVQSTAKRKDLEHKPRYFQTPSHQPEVCIGVFTISLCTPWEMRCRSPSTSVSSPRISSFNSLSTFLHDDWRRLVETAHLSCPFHTGTQNKA